MAVSDQQRLGDRYELRQIVGIGGMARVYLAHDHLLNRAVAIKILNPALAADPSFVERFRREAQAAAALNHPNIVTIFDTGMTNDTYYIVMEYVPGPNLKERVREHGPMPEDEVLSIGAQIAAALELAHRHDLIHRDIKPHNVLLPPGGQAKVTDFGIARAAGASQLTATQAVMGTAQYISPEQALHRSLDGRSDLYSLGIVLYELLAGRPPFAGDSPVAVAMQQVHDPPPPLTTVRPDIRPATEAVVMRALAKDPAARFQTAEAMRAALEDARLRLHTAEEATSALPIAPPVPPAPPTATQMLVRERYVPQPPTLDERRSRSPWIALALLPVIAAIALIGFLIVRAGGGGTTATATPGAPTVAAAAPAATATSAPTATRAAAPSPTAPPARISTPVAPAAPVATVAPSPPAPAATATAVPLTPTPLPAPTATAVPTQAPTQPPPTETPAPPQPTAAPQAPVAANGSPDQAVQSFYALAAAHNYDAAAQLWSPQQKANYPPGEYINGRFDATQRVQVTIGNVQVNAGAGRATVNVDIVETRSDGVRHYVGAWQCVRTSSGWLLDNPDLRQV